MDFFKTNKNSWNQRVETHFNSKFYDVPGFLAGQTALNPIEIEGLGSVNNKSLLHLQCHFGLDSLSWARMGAKVTGVDISDAAIAKARELNQQTGLDAEFICDDVYGFGTQNTQQHDIVFTSYGAICWLPDLTRWAKVISDHLVEGGTFYMAEFHPILDLLAGYPYFHHAEPDVAMEQTYTENADDSEHEFAVWAHPISDVISALVAAGLMIEQVSEFDYSPYDCFAGLTESQPGRYQLLHQGHPAPMVYSIKATKR